MSEVQTKKKQNTSKKNAKSTSNASIRSSNQQKKEISQAKTKTGSSPSNSNQEEEKKVGSKTTAKQKQKSSTKGWIIAVVVLSIFLVFSLITVGTLSYFVAAKTSHTAFTIGDKVRIMIMEDGSSASSIAYPRNMIPGMSVKQPIELLQPNNTPRLLLRAKLMLVASNGDSQFVNATVTEEWQVGEDGYYYYKGIGQENDLVTFATHIEIPKQLSGGEVRENCMITIVVESVQKGSGTALQLWTTAPSDWLTTYAS